MRCTRPRYITNNSVIELYPKRRIDPFERHHKSDNLLVTPLGLMTQNDKKRYTHSLPYNVKTMWINKIFNTDKYFVTQCWFTLIVVNERRVAAYLWIKLWKICSHVYCIPFLWKCFYTFWINVKTRLMFVYKWSKRFSCSVKNINSLSH